VKAIKSDSECDSDEQKKVARFFREKNRGVTSSVAATGVTHPSDATAKEDRTYLNTRTITRPVKNIFSKQFITK